jgi:hypothetical protein
MQPIKFVFNYQEMTIRLPEELSSVQEFSREEIVDAHRIPGDWDVRIALHELMSQEKKTRMKVSEIVHTCDMRW